ncbi:MAG: PleD family two-component system response regulator [Nitrospinota bacterium]
MSRQLLLADDSVTIQRVIEITFEGTDIRVHSVSDGERALAMAKKLRPGIILADVELPGIDGLELCRRLKSDPELGPIPVLLLTNSFETFDERAGKEAGAAGCIAKPFESEELVRKVESVLPAEAQETEEAQGMSEQEALPERELPGDDEESASGEEEAAGEEALEGELEPLAGSEEEEEDLEEILEELAENEDDGQPARDEVLAEKGPEERLAPSPFEGKGEAQDIRPSPVRPAPLEIPKEELRQMVSEAISAVISPLIPELVNIMRQVVREEVPPLAERLIREERERLKGGR